jgi:probable rRNA maturation factor
VIEVLCGDGVVCDPNTIEVLEENLWSVERLIELEEGVRFEDVVVQLVSESHIRELHSTYFHDDSPTDVITFPWCESGETSIRSGDIAVCVEVALDQSIDAGHGLIEELTFLGVHGLLHLCGWLDHSDVERERMLQRQAELISRAVTSS